MGMSLNIPITMVEGLLGRTQIYLKVASCCCAVECVGQTKKHIKLAYFTLHYHYSTLLWDGCHASNMGKFFLCFHYSTLLGASLHYSTLLEFMGLWGHIGCTSRIAWTSTTVR